jgi:hypothetical protein
MFKTKSHCLAALFASASLTLTAVADITTGLTAHWKFDETTGAVASDSSGNNNNASLINFQPDDSMWVTGRIGGAIAFNPPDTGDDDQVVTDAPIVLQNQDSFTFAFWAQRLPGPNPFNPRFITPVGNEHWVLWAPGQGVGFYIPAKTEEPPENAWRHYVVLYNRAAGTYSVYVDGARVVNNVSNPRPEPGEVQWVLGHKELLEDHRDPWRGYFDDMRMYNRVLSEADVLELYAVAAAVGPRIVTEPQPVTKFVGDTVSVSVVAEGTAPLRYQWFKGAATLTDATNSTFVITNAQLSDAGTYSVRITNSVGNVTSGNAVVTITDPPVDIASNLLLHYKFDETTGFTVADSSGKGHNGTLNQTIGDGSEWVTGRLGGALFMNPTDGGNDDYVVTDGALALENEDKFTFTFWAKAAPGSGVNPRIVTPTSGHWVLWTPGTGVGFFVPAASPQPVIDVWRHFAVVYDRPAGVYQLFVDGQRSGAEVGGRVRTSPVDSQWIIGHAESLASNADAFAGALDDIRVYNRILSGKDIAAIYDLAPALGVAIRTQPRSLIVSDGSPASFSVTAEGNAPVYQWRKNGTDLSGATGSTLSLTNVTAADAGQYTVFVTNSLNQVTSEAATLTVIPTLDLSTATVVASSEFNGDYTPAKAFDRLRVSTGPNSSRWASLGGALPQWIYVDLGEDKTIKQVLLDWEGAWGIDYSLRGRTAAEGVSDDPSTWTELAAVTAYSQVGNGLDGPDVVFDFVSDSVVLQSTNTANTTTSIATTEPRVRYLMIDGQTSAIGLFSIWELEVNAESSTPTPQLTITGGPNSFRISWPAGVTGYVLESSPTVPSANWTPVQGVSNNGIDQVPFGAATFYRLRRP